MTDDTPARRYIESMMTVYQRTITDQTTSALQMLKSMEGGDYTVEQYFKDIAKWWATSLQNVWLWTLPPQRWLQGGDHIPTLALHLKATSVHDPRVAPLPVGIRPGVTIGPMDDLPSLEPGGKSFPRQAVITEVLWGTHLSVRVQQSESWTQPTKGRWGGLLFAESTPVAYLQILKQS